MYSELARPYAPVAFVKTVSSGRQPWIYPSTPALFVCNHLSLSPVEMSFGLTLPRIIRVLHVLALCLALFINKRLPRRDFFEPHALIGLRLHRN